MTREPGDEISRLDYVRIQAGNLIRNGIELAATESNDPAVLYRTLGYEYPKFFKMDRLCKWAWLGAEALFRKEDGTYLYDGLDRSEIALVLATRDGCLETDQRYADSMKGIPSPALFVYTLPNIMLGEICIRHRFTGEQLCLVQEGFDMNELLHAVKGIFERGAASHCLFGWVDAVGEHHDVSLFWAGREALKDCSPEQLQAVHNKGI